MTMSSKRAYVAEFLGTAILLATIVGSGEMGLRLSGGNAGLALLANAIATGAVLYVLILGLGPLSGGYYNPVVTVIEVVTRKLSRERLIGYVAAQVLGALLGVLVAHAMFGLDLIEHSHHARLTGGELLGEVIATFGLCLVIATVTRAKPVAVPGAVALYIVAAYWFTSSTSFANPAVTFARSFTDTFAGIRHVDVLPFIGAQVVGGALSALLVSWLFRDPNPESRELE
jgi:glycerol uptake facilitator-like aquaporin